MALVRAVSVVLCCFVVSFPSYAASFKSKKVIDGTAYEGNFNNGAMFILRQKSSGKNELVYEYQGRKEIFSTPTFDKFPYFHEIESKFVGAYSANTEDHAFFFAQGNTLFMLTEEGLFKEVLSHPERFREKGGFVIVADLQDSDGKKYAVISGKYEEDVLVKGYHTGETYLVRIQDGAVALVDREFHKAFSATQFSDGIFNVTPIDAFELSKFEEEGKNREAKYPFIPVQGAEDALVDTARPSDVNGESKSYVFENGAKLVKEKGANGIQVFMIDPSGSKTLLSEGRAGSFPKAAVLASDQKIVTFETDQGLRFVTESGVSSVLPANYAMVKGRTNYTRSEFVFALEGRQYALISFVYQNANKMGEGPGETFLIRDDGRFFRVNYVSLDLTEAEVESMIQDGILYMAGSYRDIDLRAFDTEARFDAKMGTKSPKEIFESLNGLLKNMSVDARSHRKAYKPNPGSTQEKTLHNVRISLQKEEKRSVVILGDSGVGKTKAVEYLIEAIAHGEVPEIPRTWNVYKLDPVNFNAGASLVGMHEARTQSVLDAAKIAPMYFFIDEIHSLRGSGTHSGNQNDVFQNLKPALADGDLMIIGTSTSEEYGQAFEGDAALTRRINKVVMTEPAGTEVETLVKGWIKKFRKVMPDEEVLHYIIRVADEFNAAGTQPTKTIDLLEQIYAEMAVERRASEKPLAKDVDGAAQKLYQADPAYFDLSTMNQRLKNLEKIFSEEIVGQELPVKVLIDLVRQAYAGTHENDKPRVRLLNVGPPATGKTEMGLLLARGLGLPLVRFEMNNFRPGEEQKFLSQVAQALRKNAFSVLLFDEFEKAPKEIQDALLALMDSGHFTVEENLNTSARGGSRRVKMSGRNAMIILTSNAGTSFIQDRFSEGKKAPLGFKMEIPNGTTEAKRVPLTLDSELLFEKIIQDGVSRPAVDRVQAVVASLPATREQFGRILQLQLKKAFKRQREKHQLTISFSNEDVFIEHLLKTHYKPGISNRRAIEIIQNTVRSVLADALLDGKVKKGGTIAFTFDGEKIVIANCEQLLL